MDWQLDLGHFQRSSYGDRQGLSVVYPPEGIKTHFCQGCCCIDVILFRRTLGNFKCNCSMPQLRVHPSEISQNSALRQRPPYIFPCRLPIADMTDLKVWSGNLQAHTGNFVKTQYLLGRYGESRPFSYRLEPDTKYPRFFDGSVGFFISL